MNMPLWSLRRWVSSIHILSLSLSMAVRPLYEISIKPTFSSQLFYHIFEVVTVVGGVTIYFMVLAVLAATSPFFIFNRSRGWQPFSVANLSVYIHYRNFQRSIRVIFSGSLETEFFLFLGFPFPSLLLMEGAQVTNSGLST